jgi:hypothetical protein
MGERIPTVQVFSLEERQRARSEAGLPPSDAYSPYAAAWKEFDKLEKLAKGHSPEAWIHWVWGWVVALIGTVGVYKASKKHALMAALAWGALGLFQIVRARNAKERFIHWPCPRCHTEWPGTKTEKENTCKACGLRLHQMCS